MSKVEDLLTVSVGSARKAWVQANKFQSSKAMQRAIDEAMAGPAPVMPRSIGRRKVRVVCVFRKRALYRSGVMLRVATEAKTGAAWSRLRPYLWTVRAPASEVARLVSEAKAAGLTVTPAAEYVILTAVAAARTDAPEAPTAGLRLVSAVRAAVASDPVRAARVEAAVMAALGVTP